jgi:hypothetical protein
MGDFRGDASLCLVSTIMITEARMTINTWKGPRISAVLKYVQHLFFNPLIEEHFSVHRPIITGRNT